MDIKAKQEGYQIIISKKDEFGNENNSVIIKLGEGEYSISFQEDIYDLKYDDLKIGEIYQTTYPNQGTYIFKCGYHKWINFDKKWQNKKCC